MGWEAHQMEQKGQSRKREGGQENEAGEGQISQRGT